jgi:hypothetical protein
MTGSEIRRSDDWRYESQRRKTRQRIVQQGRKTEVQFSTNTCRRIWRDSLLVTMVDRQRWDYCANRFGARQVKSRVSARFGAIFLAFRGNADSACVFSDL